MRFVKVLLRCKLLGLSVNVVIILLKTTSCRLIYVLKNKNKQINSYVVTVIVIYYVRVLLFPSSLLERTYIYELN